MRSSFLIIVTLWSVVAVGCGTPLKLPELGASTTDRRESAEYPGIASGLNPHLTDMVPFTDHPNRHWDSDPVYILISGYGSCASTNREQRENPFGSNLYRAFAQHMNHRLNHSEPGSIRNWIVACQPRDDRITYYYSSRSPNTLQSGTQYHIHEEAAIISREQKAPVILIGHSYGGAYVMQAALQIASDIPIRYLLTLDPISPLHCRPEHLLKLGFGRINQVLGRTGAPQVEGCTTSPPEYVREHRELINLRVQSWQHYYQDDLFSLLKATRIDQACNQYIQHDSVTKSANGHVAMEFYPKLWRDIDQLLDRAGDGACVEKHI